MNQQNQNQNHLAIVQPSFNSLRNHSLALIIKQKRNALSLITPSTRSSLPPSPSRSRQHTRIISPVQSLIDNRNTSSRYDDQLDSTTKSSLKQTNHDQSNPQSSKSTSKHLPSSFINLLTNNPLDSSDPSLSQVVMTPTTEEWWSFGGISKIKSGLSSPVAACTQLKTQVEEKSQDNVDEDEEEEEEEEEEEDQIDDQSDHTGSSSNESYERTQPEPSSSTTTTPDNSPEIFNHDHHHHPKLPSSTIPNSPSDQVSSPNSPSDQLSSPNSPLDFSNSLIFTEPEVTQALPTLTSVNGIINVPSNSVDNPSSRVSESVVPFPTLTAMSSNSVGRASQYPNSPLTSTALLSSLLDKAPQSATLRPCSLLHDGIVRKSIDPRSYSAMTGHRNLDSFVIQSSAGSGAYGIVKHAQEKGPDGHPTGPPLVIKYIIKQRILADCWKRHKVLGPIPVEIHVLDHLRRVNSRPSIITMAKAYIQSRGSEWESKSIKTIPSRVELAEFFTKREELADTNQENLAQLSCQQRTGHPNICGILDYFEDSDYYYLVMPRFGDGKDLFEHIEMAPEGLPWEEVRRIFGQVVDGVAYLHERNIAHRDLKDENVILDGNGNAQLIDFGSASYVREGIKFETFSGTLDFAAPEVLKGIPHGGKEIDIWALGVILYVLITGECPFWNPEEASRGIGTGTRSRSKLEEHLANKSKNSDKNKNQDQIENPEPILDLLDHCLNLDSDQRPAVELICWHKFFLPQAGWIGPQIPKIAFSTSNLDPSSTTTPSTIAHT